MLDRWMRALRGGGPANGSLEGTDPAIVASLPPAVREGIGGALPLMLTYDAYAELFRGARRALKLFVPYVDPTFTALASLTQAPIKVLTTVAEGRGARTSPVLERCSTVRDVTVRYLSERRQKSLMYQVHAKLLISDGEAAYVGSANLTDTSIHYNLELGLLVRDRSVVSKLERLFDIMFDRVGVPAKLVG